MVDRSLEAGRRLRAARHPHLVAATSTDVDLTLDTLFEFGLARLLDGYAVFLGDPPQRVTQAVPI